MNRCQKYSNKEFAKVNSHFLKAFQSSRLVSINNNIQTYENFCKKQLQQSNLQGSSSKSSKTNQSAWQNQLKNQTHKKVPRLQVIGTTPASKYRMDWGLKSKLPTKDMPSYIVVESMEKNQMTGFDRGSSFALTRRRIQQLQVPVYPIFTQSLKGSVNTMFSSPYIDLGRSKKPEGVENRSISRDDKKKIIDEYLNDSSALSKEQRTLLKNEKLTDLVYSLINPPKHMIESVTKSFENEKKTSLVANIDDIYSLISGPIGTAGLSYLIPGSVHVRAPEPPSAFGIKDESKETVLGHQQYVPTKDHVVPGRFVESRHGFKNKTIAVAGVLGTLANTNYNRGVVPTVPDNRKVYPMIIGSLHVSEEDASIDMKVVLPSLPTDRGQNKTISLVSGKSEIDVTNSVKRLIVSNSKSNTTHNDKKSGKNKTRSKTKQRK